jgi:uncharacterized pyridoxamine 5'-phosphate oxidase family protein
MNKQEILEIIRKNPAFYIATLDGDQPRVRCVFLYRADEQGIIFHTGAMKDLYKQIEAYPKVEMCFHDRELNVQIRVSGALEQIKDNAFKDEICAHPSRAFLKPWRESGHLQDFYNVFTVYRLKNGLATMWTFANNAGPKTVINLGDE